MARALSFLDGFSYCKNIMTPPQSMLVRSLSLSHNLMLSRPVCVHFLAPSSSQIVGSHVDQGKSNCNLYSYAAKEWFQRQKIGAHKKEAKADNRKGGNRFCSCYVDMHRNNCSSDLVLYLSPLRITTWWVSRSPHDERNCLRHFILSGSRCGRSHAPRASGRCSCTEGLSHPTDLWTPALVDNA